MRLLLFGLLALTACSSPPAASDAPRGADADRAAVLDLLAHADTSAFRSAFEALQGRSYTRYDRFVHRTASTLTGTQTRIVRVSPDSSEILRQERAGIFETESALRSTLAPANPRADLDLTAFALPTDPAYLQPRHADTYTYRLLPDTLLGTTRTRVVEIAVRPEADDPPPVRRVRYWLDATNDRVLAVELARIDRGLGFAEASRYYLRIRPLGDAFVPDLGRFSTATRLPFRAPRRIDRQVAYYAFGP